MSLTFPARAGMNPMRVKLRIKLCLPRPVVSLLSVAQWLCGGFPHKYDNELRGFIEFTTPDSVVFTGLSLHAFLRSN